MKPETPMWDVVVAGAGIAGATFALALKHAVGDALTITLCDPTLVTTTAGAPHRASFRAVAVAADTQHNLATLGLWDDLAPEAQPIRSMAITDARPGLLPNPVFLSFTEADPDQPIGHMVFADAVRRRLLDACRGAGVLFKTSAVVGFRDEPYGLQLTLTDGRTCRTRLLAAADGGRSRLRHAARIQTVGTDYLQSAVVATLSHTEDHGGQAAQHFFPAGPIALLPMRSPDGSQHRTSLVWTERHDEAARLVALPDDRFIAALQDRIGFERGALALEDRPSAHPLALVLARRLTARRFALLGDAARVIHPLAGQGLNLGLRDAMALAHHVAGTARLGLDPGAPSVLADYERDRRFDATMMAAATDLLDRLFSNDVMPIRTLRDIGLGLVDRSPALKRQFIRHAGSAPFGRVQAASLSESGSESRSARSARASTMATTERRSF